MAETVYRGPSVVLGSLMDNRIEAFDGPSIGYQGDVIADPRFGPSAKDGLAPGRIPGFYNAWFTVTADNIPQATSSTIIAAAQAPSTTAGVALSLTTAVIGQGGGQPAWAPGVPIVPFGTTVAQTVSVIDFGFSAATTVANSTTLTVLDNTQFYVGQWIVIAGGAASNQATITQVASIATANLTSLTVTVAPAQGSSNLPIGQGNLYTQFLPTGTQFGPSTASAFAAEPYRLAGLAKAFDPAQGLTRNLVFQSAATASGTGTFLVSGFDVYGVAMTELITASGTSPFGVGKKAWKYITGIKTVTAGTTGTPPNVTVGYGNLVGFNLRSDKWEYQDIFYNGGFSFNNAGWTSAVTGTQTSTTGDVRGTQNLSTILVGGANGTAITPPGQINGTSRLTLFQQVPMVAAFGSNPQTSILLFGYQQSTATS